MDADLRERFMMHVKAETAFGTSYGLALGYASREYRQNRQIDRITERVAENKDNLIELIEAGADGGGGDLPKQEREAVEICQRFTKYDQFPKSDLHEEIENVTGRDSEYIINDRTKRVLERGNYVTHPFTPALYVPASERDEIIERRRQQREAEAEAKAADEMADLEDAEPKRQVTAGGEDQ